MWSLISSLRQDFFCSSRPFILSLIRSFIVKIKHSFAGLSIFLFTNLLFIFKYLSRYSASSPLLSGLVYIVFVLGLFFLVTGLRNRFSEQTFKVLSWIIIAGAFSVIGLALWKIDPLSVCVDRWSATSYFLDALFDGRYPYGVHTHVPPTAHSYPSPFPFWQYVNIPFWLMGDVGYGLFFFLLLPFLAVKWFTNSYKSTFLFFLLLFLSPAYWWEVTVRSDGLSNAMLIFCLILYLEKKRITFSTHFWTLVLLCGCVAATRLSAVIPMALYLLLPYTRQSSVGRLILFPVSVLLVAGYFFLPYIFWDTETWIFFSRNPFMEQMRQGNSLVTLTILLLGIGLALRSKTFMQRIRTISWIVFLFILLTQIVRFAGDSFPGFLFNDDCDISYFTLAFPYCLFSLSAAMRDGEDE